MSPSISNRTSLVAGFITCACKPIRRSSRASSAIEQSLPSGVGEIVGVSVGVLVGVLVEEFLLGAARVNPPIIRISKSRPVADPMAICLRYFSGELGDGIYAPNGSSPLNFRP